MPALCSGQWAARAEVKAARASLCAVWEEEVLALLITDRAPGARLGLEGLSPRAGSPNCRPSIFGSRLTSEYDSLRGPCHQRLTGLQARVENDHRQPVGHLCPHLGLRLDPVEEEGGRDWSSAPPKLVLGGGAHPVPGSPCPHPGGLDTLPRGGSSPRGRRIRARVGTCRVCPRLREVQLEPRAPGALPTPDTPGVATVFISRTPLHGASAQPGAPRTWAPLREASTWRLSLSVSQCKSPCPTGGRSSPVPFMHHPLHEDPLPQASRPTSGLPCAPLPRGPCCSLSGPRHPPPTCGQGVREASTWPWGLPRSGSLPGSGGQPWTPSESEAWACRAGNTPSPPSSMEAPRWRSRLGG